MKEGKPKAYEDWYADLYDLENADKNDDIQFLMPYVTSSGSPVLELGCGTGRVLIPIASAGFQITGIDSSSKMLKLAREKVKQKSRDVQSRIKLLKMDMCSFSLKQKFQICICPYYSLMHVLNRIDQEGVIKLVHSHLAEKGLFVAETFTPRLEEVLLLQGKLFHRYTKVQQNTDTSVSRFDVNRYDLGGQTITATFFLNLTDMQGISRQMTGAYKFRFIHRYEFELMMEKNGFTVEGLYGGYDKQGYRGEGTLIIVGRKK